MQEERKVHLDVALTLIRFCPLPQVKKIEFRPRDVGWNEGISMTPEIGLCGNRMFACFITINVPASEVEMNITKPDACRIDRFIPTKLQFQTPFLVFYFAITHTASCDAIVPNLIYGKTAARQDTKRSQCRALRKQDFLSIFLRLKREPFIRSS